MFPFRAKSNPYMLIVGMAGVKMGDQLLQIGCSDGGALAAVASKVGLSGRATAVVPDDPSAERVRRGAAAEGVLVDVEVAPSTALPVEAAVFDLVIVDDRQRGFAALDADTQAATAREASRTLKPGGRCLVITSLPATGLAAMLGRGNTAPAFDPTPALNGGGFRFVRTLGEREGLRFVEGVKPRT
jgi:ubiquinone/menaquinone biosynthesis C-methylase UbiE